MFGPVHSFIFDFDGTLVDTMGSVIQGLKEAVELGSGKTVEVDALVATFGSAPEDVLKKWMPVDRVPVALKHWHDFEARASAGEMIPFKGVPELLEAIRTRGHKLGVFTGRDRDGTLRIMKHNGWFGKYFTEATMVCGDDGHGAKPNPAPLVYLLNAMKLDPATTLMVGDHPYDMQAGRGAGTKTAAALWDIPKTGGTARSLYRAGWQKWDGVACDLRLESPESLRLWIESQREP